LKEEKREKMRGNERKPTKSAGGGSEGGGER